ncbi:MAG TPA: non-canonical purine NTP pyrophosphatase, partial [Chthoniobacterales bacterium]|nr:non-canonical purine NTP pyrophosphatase [Chthoniobacterales bacterium]
MQTLLVATWNAHKTREIGQILGSGWNVRDLTTLVDAPRVEETGSTFAENAALKAVAISESFPGLVLADDSGLAVDALNGEPGVYSARFA